ncbi:MAG: FecR domain-containing protein [Desulfobacterales bacterium]
MRSGRRTHPEFWVLFACIVALMIPGDLAAQPCENPIAKIVSVQGAVEARGKGGRDWRPVSLYDTFCSGDSIRVLENSRADITLMDRSFLRINQNTTIILEEVLEERTSLIDLLKGAAHFLSREPRSVKVKTHYAIFGVRGTEFFISSDDRQAFLSVFAGAVRVENDLGSLILGKGQSAVARAGSAPVPRVVARPRDAVQWALYYPPVLYDLPAERIALEPEAIEDPTVLTRRSALLLNVGRVEEAYADLDRALGLDPGFSDALALQAIVAIVRNDKDKALDLARKAVEADPGSATALIALSYARQARFDLEGARTALQEAVGAEPDNALAWARLSDIHASFGDLGKALETAKRAESLAPDLALTQTVLGFAYLIQVKIDEAKAAFEKAIRLDQAAPLPRLGMGLARIREGDLEGGGREMEIAASLDPNNSLIRSYLGKTYYEEKRMPLDEREYEIAKELDPNDPTPWFYDAIAKQTTNRPVEALHNLQKAIELNDNRFVYRSRLLLDSDLAARQSSLARIYDELGFGQRALFEGWQALSSDPTNFSAHRFLSDSYTVLPRREISRVSELLQAQLLQPINISPVQPRSGESNLFLISGQGPGFPSFNTYNPLFNRNQVALQTTGLFGENDTWAGEGIVSSLYDRFSLSAGYYHFDTEGWRENADQRDGIANIFGQFELSYNTSFQAEYRYRNTEKGDLDLRFDPDGYYPYLKDESEIDTFRFGMRHSFSPESVLLGSFTYQENNSDVTNIVEDSVGLPSPPFVPGSNAQVRVEPEFDINEDAFSGEIQYLLRSDYINSTSGVGYFRINGKEDQIRRQSVLFPPPFSFLSSSGIINEKVSLDVDHANFYHYFYINFPQKLSLTLGASVDFFDSDFSETEDRDQFNPKFGLIWNPFEGTSVRGAVFRVLKRTLITDQTLEPTQVSGFNQFYDDLTSTESWLYGIALDQKINASLYGGIEFFRRDLDAPVPIESDFPDDRDDWREDMMRAYVYWAPFQWISMSAEYQYERFEYSDEFNFGAKEITTQRFPLGINLFHLSGLSFSVKGTYYHQDGEFLPLLEDFSPENYVSDEDHFWIFDVALNYRIPQRKGFLSVGASNLFDEDFNYFETDFSNPFIYQGRVFYVMLSLTIP